MIFTSTKAQTPESKLADLSARHLKLRQAYSARLRELEALRHANAEAAHRHIEDAEAAIRCLGGASSTDLARSQALVETAFRKLADRLSAAPVEDALDVAPIDLLVLAMILPATVGDLREALNVASGRYAVALHRARKREGLEESMIVDFRAGR